MTEWECGACKRRVTTYVGLSQPPTCWHEKGKKHHFMYAVDRPTKRSTRLPTTGEGDKGGGGN